MPGCDSAGAAERSYPMSGKGQLCGRRRTERSYSTFKVRRGGSKEIPLIQSGAAAVLCWSSHEGIPHAQGKRN